VPSASIEDLWKLNHLLKQQEAKMTEIATLKLQLAQLQTRIDKITDRQALYKVANKKMIAREKVFLVKIENHAATATKAQETASQAETAYKRAEGERTVLQGELATSNSELVAARAESQEVSSRLLAATTELERLRAIETAKVEAEVAKAAAKAEAVQRAAKADFDRQMQERADEDAVRMEEASKAVALQAIGDVTLSDSDSDLEHIGRLSDPEPDADDEADMEDP
jgi:hypothetical protein